MVIARAFAKINLTLDVGPRRGDGYHVIASVMQTVSLCDHLTVCLNTTGAITLDCSDAAIPCGADNTAVRAAVSLLNRVGADHGVHIALDKRIPAEAGLGGGSSDAAATLRAVAHLLGLPADSDSLSAYAAAIGSDVPFFLTGGTALATGRGEIITTLPAAPTLHLVIVKPCAGVSTAAAYRALDASNPMEEEPATSRVVEALRAGDKDALIAGMANDFERVLPDVCPEAMAAIRRMIAAGALTAHLCGSGSAVFGVASDREAAERIASHLRSHFAFAAACETVASVQSLVIEESA
jgi:4-diphosphocytidyl-2-C-methyl-D-erythritol kinase